MANTEKQPFVQKIDFSKRVLAVLLSLFSLYTAAFGVLPGILQRSVHLLFILLIVFFTIRDKQKKLLSVANLVFALLSVICFGFLILNYKTIFSKFGLLSTFEILIGIIAVVLVLEASRRTAGWPIVLVALAFIAYGVFGQHLSGMFRHRGYSLERIISQFFYGTGGLFGIPLGASATFVILFIIFGSFLNNSGASKLFMELAILLTGRTIGGPAKVSVLASAFMGTISGSATANVVTTGTFTIPLMKYSGYKPKFAGAVEAVASTGSQLMPPIMGAAAFIMVEITGISYSTIAIAAVIPSILYYGSLYSVVHFQALKSNLGRMDDKDIPSLQYVILHKGHLLLPILLLITLLVLGYSPMLSVLLATIAIIVVSWIRKDTRMGLHMIIASLREGAEGTVVVATACAAAGLVSGIISLTGFGLKISSVLTILAGQNLMLALIFTMISCIILGMGLPTAPVYILVSALMAPALINLGISVLAAHMFVFYSALLSAITPPVAVAAYAAAGIAKERPMRIAMTACKIGIVIFIIPYFFIFQETLLAQGSAINVITSGIVALVGTVVIGVSTVGFLFKKIPFIVRIIIFVSGLLLIDRAFVTDIIGFIVVSLFVLVQWIQVKRSNKEVKKPTSPISDNTNENSMHDDGD